MDLAATEDTGAKEKQIIRRIRQGEKDDFRHLVEVHQGKVFSMILKQIANEQLAKASEKLTQLIVNSFDERAPRIKQWLTTGPVTKQGNPISPESADRALIGMKARLPRFAQNTVDILSKTGMGLVEREEHLLRDIWRIMRDAELAKQKPAPAPEPAQV